jgi:hypothetical protein
MRSRGNLFLLSDGLRFLQGQEQLAGVVESEEDKPVLHSRGEDLIWFYGTVFAIPLLVLGLGLSFVRRRRQYPATLEARS